MCQVTLLALFSTLPISMAIAGPQGPEGGLFSQKINLENEQHAHAIATLVRRLPRENQCFSALSTLAVALVAGFLIVRCFIAMTPRLKHERPIVSRRLASGAAQICSEEGQIFVNDAGQAAQKDNTWKKLLKPAIIVGAGAIIGAAMGAGITAGVVKQERNQLQLQLNQLNQLAVLPPLKPLLLKPLPLTMTNTLMKRFPQNKLSLNLHKINERLANFFVAFAVKGQKRILSDKLMNYADYLIKEEVLASGQPVEVKKKIIADLQTQYYASIEKMVENDMEAQALENARDALENARARDALEKARDALRKHLPEKIRANRTTLRVKDLGLTTDIIDYCILTLLSGKKPEEDEIIYELATYADSFIATMLESHFVDLTNFDNYQNEVLAEMRNQYYLSIEKMINKEKSVITAYQETAYQETAYEKCSSFAYQVTPAVANTVKAIQDGTFKLD